MKKIFTLQTLTLVVSMLIASLSVHAEEDKDTTIVVPETGYMVIKPSRNFTGPAGIIVCSINGSSNASSTGITFNQFRLNEVVMAGSTNSSSGLFLIAQPGEYTLTLTDAEVTGKIFSTITYWVDENTQAYKKNCQLYKFVNTPGRVGFERDAKYASDNYQYCDLGAGEHVYLPLNETIVTKCASLLETTVADLDFIPWDGPWKNVPTLADVQSPLLESLAGQWQFTASNNGTEDATVKGLYHPGTDTFSFTATVDGASLSCHTDCLYKSAAGNEYPADWKMVVEENDQNQYRIGWVLTKEQPTFSREFLEPKENYLENGFYYWGDGVTDSHRYVYLLTENEDASAYVATTFWSPWVETGTTEYSLSSTEQNSRKFYAIVAASQPFADSVGYIEIWASPKVERVDITGISLTPNLSPNGEGSGYYNLWGQRVEKPQKGVYIVNGRKVFFK